MTWLIILIGVVIVLFLLGQIRLGGGVKYSTDGFYVQLRVGLFWFSVYPFKKNKKEKIAKPQKEKLREEPKEKGGSLELVKQTLPLICEAAGELKRKIQIDRLDLYFIAASEDAANAAMAFGYANMAIGMLWPLFEQNFLVKEHDFRTSVDFDVDTPTIHINAALSLKLGLLVSFGLRYGAKLIKVYMDTKRAQRARMKNQKEAI